MEKLSGYLVALFLVFVMMISGCGGGGSSAAVPTQPVDACTDAMRNTWTPDASTVPENRTAMQTNGCRETRTVQGTKFVDYWQERAGASVATPFKSYSGVTSRVVATKDSAAGSVLFGQDIATKKGALVRLDANGNQLFSVQINPVLGNEVIPHNIDCDGNRIAVAFECLPYNDWYILVFDMNGNQLMVNPISINGSAENGRTDDWRVESAIIKLDGNYLFNRRIYKSGKSVLVRASLISSDAPISAAPLVVPEFMTTDNFGINIIGSEGILKYDRALVAQGSPTTWRTPAQSFKIHDSIVAANLMYTAIAWDDMLMLSKFSDSAFRNTKIIPIGSDLIKLDVDVAGNLFVTVGNRMDRIDMATGDVSTIRPPAVPANVPWYISGDNVYFIVNSNALHVLPLSQIP